MTRHRERYRRVSWIVGGVVAGTLLATTIVLFGPAGPEPVAQASGEAADTGNEDGDVQLPGAPPFPSELEQRLLDAYEAKGPDYEPRTHHFDESGEPKYVNRLILEKSPYLLQHAHNPVNWYPWGDEAFERARKENKPVLLSVGYSTCHWCHVMERESFEDEEIARFMNEHYIAIKVDRERRPDVDSIYMAAVRAFSGGGGWPMTVWLTPDRKPFFGGTYFPPRDGDRGARFGFLTLLKQLRGFYRENPEKAVAQAEKATAHIQRALTAGGSSVSAEVPRKELVSAVDRTFSSLSSRFDEEHGGFGDAPKFPRSVNLEFLLRYHHRTGNEPALEMVVKTLEEMAAGGMYDHVGGGFHRYSTDAKWLVPHFEKMLYDNALLTIAYLEAHQATGRKDFARVARDVLRYVARDMTSPKGAFYSATDADSEGEEGKFFVWTPDQIEAVLGKDRAKWFNSYYGVTEEGNFEHGTTILHMAEPLESVARRFDMKPETLRTKLDEARGDLYEAREERVHPIRDEKILVSWNGLMISAFARAAHVFGEDDYAGRAKKAADFVLTNMKEDGRLHRSWFDGHAEGTGYLDDHSFLIQGLLDLYEATFEPRWLREAIALQEVLQEHFWDEKGGGYFATPDDAEELLAREKPTYDGAEPSGNSVAILNLLRLEEFTVDDRYRVLAEKAFGAFGGILERGPSAVPKMLTAVEFHLDTPKEIMIVKPDASVSAEPMLAKLREVYLPNRVLAIASEGEGLEEQRKLIPLLRERIAMKGEVTAYVCENRVCDLPTRDPEVFAKQIREKAS